MKQVEQITITAKDGYPLAATHYHASNSKALMIVAGATGVPQGFYRRFAEYVCQQNIDVVTLDYRGIGRSAPKTLRGFDMDYLDWAHKDLNAAMHYVKTFDLPLLWVGHSFGGHAAGLMPNSDAIIGAWFFGTGAGWHGWMPKTESIRVQFMWNFIAPIVTRIYGYLNWGLLGMGENLPLGVYKKWKRWCSFPNYFFDDPKMPDIALQFENFSAPIVAANALDDKWASSRSRAAFMQGYKNAEVEDLDLNPKEHGNIGHMGYFRASCEPIWRRMLDWMEVRLKQESHS